MNRRAGIQRIEWAASVLSFLCAVLGVLGCDQSCEADLTCPYDFPTGGASSASSAGGTGGAGGGYVCPDDPVDAPIAEECGVWLSASLGDDKNDGTQAAPVKTIAAATVLAAYGGTFRVYACGEKYEEAVALYSGVSVFGGFDCDNEWRYVKELKRALIAPGIGGAIPLMLLEGDATSMLRDVDISAADATAPGGSSIGVFALAGSKAHLQRVHITAGNGAHGADGEDGSHGAPPAQPGLTGSDGTDACTMDEGLGGAALLIQCESGTSHGGQGGKGGAVAATGGGNGLQPPDFNPEGYGAGGKGEDAIAGNACTAGFGGAHGTPGPDGDGASGPGRLTTAGYAGDAGKDGGLGLPGQGGGGGGASIGGAVCGAGVPKGGAGGGAGGTGGCGGQLGKGGQAGGSSIAVASLSPDIKLHDVRLTSGNGGNGGDGGAGQPGGQGGLPGMGGAGFKPGCAGGVGGYGGDGGNGGGGRGGHSLYAAHTSGNKPNGDWNDIVLGKPGSGGLGGSGATASAQGVPGQTDALTLNP